MSYYEIPLDNTQFAQRSFTVSLKNNSINAHIKLRLRYLDLYDVWVADVFNATTNEELISGMPLVCGINLLEQYKYLDIGEAYMVKVKVNDLEHPDGAALGDSFVLMWGDDT